ncbi:hypothetical protein [Jiangella alba]|uniref:Uncharacterized protein n=1 Tax=Jiangella alba TaxID=561176 RepID=A0A1H5J533_9ACTN|nr:hypothetical protein [Jiangella alba]SEE47171.1 hypothetical protein SAMN04488561_1430 [Jiangella alba]
MMTDLYPEPPHLSAFVEPGLEQSTALLAAWGVLTASGCVFSGDVLVARDHGWFRDVSDVEREVVQHSGSPRDLLVNRDPLRIQFRHRSIGVVALGLSSAVEFGEPHPVEVAIHAGPLSLPVKLWSRQDRQAAKRLSGWMERLLLAISGPTEAQYGALGIEAQFPTPAGLAGIHRSAVWPTTWFWPSQLSTRAAFEERELLSSLSQGAVTRSREGTLFRAWRPGAEVAVDEPGIDSVVNFLNRVIGTPR